MSGAHFFTSVSFLPYKMGVNSPNECIYTLGYYRPGNCPPYLIEPIPLSLQGAVCKPGSSPTGLVDVAPILIAAAATRTHCLHCLISPRRVAGGGATARNPTEKESAR